MLDMNPPRCHSKAPLAPISSTGRRSLHLWQFGPPPPSGRFRATRAASPPYSPPLAPNLPREPFPTSIFTREPRYAERHSLPKLPLRHGGRCSQPQAPLRPQPLQMDAVPPPDHPHIASASNGGLCRRGSPLEMARVSVEARTGGKKMNPTGGDHLSVSQPKPLVAQPDRYVFLWWKRISGKYATNLRRRSPGEPFSVFYFF